MARINDAVKVLGGVSKVASEGRSLLFQAVSSRFPFIVGVYNTCCPTQRESEETTFDDDLPEHLVYDNVNTAGLHKREYHTLAAGRTTSFNRTRPSCIPPVSQKGRPSLHYRLIHTHAVLPQADATVVNSEGSVGKVQRGGGSKLNASQERKVPVTRIGRVAAFGGLFVKAGANAATEMAKRAVGMGDTSGSGMLTKSMLDDLVDTLCRVRGAALKFGQMISIQDNSLMPPEIREAFERVRNGADFMPMKQMESVLEAELGSDWSSRFSHFDPKPFAAASVGQVHQAVLPGGEEVAVKIQYPGIADSIDSDISNLLAILKMWNILPEGLFVDDAATVARRELKWETDYIREASWAEKFRGVLSGDEMLHVPRVFPSLSTKRVLTSELISGQPVDQLDGIDQDSRNEICTKLMELSLRELFEFQFMQTDPNWSNFFFDKDTRRIHLLDFGASRDFSKSFVDKYIKVIHAASRKDREGVIAHSKTLGFLTGYETKEMIQAHADTVMVLGEPFSSEEPFDFGSQLITHKVRKLIPVMMRHRLTPPPEESYSIHRKMSGMFLLSSQLKATVNAKPLFDTIYNNYKFSIPS